MKKEPMILALDAGTGDCRAIAFSADGRVMESAQMEWSYDARAAGIPGGYAFEPARCWADVKGLLHKVLSRLPDHQAKAVTVTSQRDGMVYLDRTGRELYCAPNMDLRGACVLQELEPDQEEILKRTGLPLHAMFGQSATYGRRLRKVEFTSQSEKSCFHHEIFQTAKVLKKRETATMPLMPHPKV